MDIKALLSNYRKGKTANIPSAINMRSRLLIFLLLLTATMLAGVLFLLSVFGVFTLDSGETEKLFSNELTHLSGSLSTQYANAMSRAARMSDSLSAGIGAFMRQEGSSPAETSPSATMAAGIKSRPELLEPLLKELLPTVLVSLDATDCSGVFITLDATVNPLNSGRANSKAGLYIRNLEPNIGGMGHKSRYLLRGFPSLISDDSYPASQGSLNIQSTWKMEFNIGNLPFWYEPLKEYAANPSLPLSRLVYWSFASPLQDINEDMMICSVPLIDVNGNFLGVCGFEISAMNFMLRYEPRIIDSFHNIIFSFSSAFGSQLFLGEALFSGNNAVYNSFPKQGRMNRTVSINSFVAYELGGKNYIGMERPVRLYPDDSPFMRSAYLAALLIPEADFYAMRKLARLRLGLLLFLLTAIGVAASILLSRRFTKPIIEKLNEAGESSLPTVRTNITEIDILLERLSVKGSPLPKNLFDDFLAKVKTLTPTELVVFQAHAEGKSLDRMAKNMFISANTLKTHNKHIYEKLEVSSKEELRLYISLLEKCGMMERIFSDSKADG